MLIETIISSAGGMLAGLVPTAVKIFRSAQQHRQEMAARRLSAELQERLGAQRIEETAANNATAELTAAYAHDTAGIDRAPAWAIAIRILQRPAMAWAVLGAFIWAGTYCLLAGLTEPMDIFNRTAHFANFVMVYYFTDRGAAKRFGTEK